MPNVADITDADLDRMHAETLAERGEAPPDLPGEQPDTEADAEDQPLGWIPRGSWRWRHSNPAELSSDESGRTLLNLTLQTSRPPLHGELDQFANDLDNRARGEALSRLQGTPEWTAFIEAKAELNSVKTRLATLETETRDLEAERLRLAAKPRGQGQRLASIQERQSKIGSERHAAGMELQALEPILTDARRKAQELAREIALETIQGIRQEQQQTLDHALAEFYRKHGDEISGIAARVAARSSQSHDSWVAGLRSFIVSRLENAQPATEPAKA